MRYDSRLDLLLSVASLLKNEDFRFLIVGGGPLAHEIEQAAQKMGDERIVVLPQVSRGTALLYVRASDLTWVVCRNPKTSMNTRIGMPWKFLESLASGVPVVVEDGSFRAKLVRELGCGLVVESDVPNLVMEAIVKLASDSVMLGNMRIATDKAAAMMFSWDAMERKLVDNYKQLESRICLR
jgi:glycosyltransferase involved in cell wall biosynthesis